jgi:formate hydrogenlyase subunit 3/multisubunit Na+/H+ antiporter MnhD subunit
VAWLVVVGLLTWLVAFIRIAYLSGPTWLADDLWVLGAVLLLSGVIVAWFWKDSRRLDAPSPSES